MSTKVCFKCFVEKPLSDFYKHKRMADGHLNKCKECTKKDTKERADDLSNDPAWVEKEKERQRIKYHRLGYLEKHKPSADDKRRAMRNYHEKYPEKMRCRGRMKKIRGKIGVDDSLELHHWNYGKGFEDDVIILKKEEHYTAHRFLEYDQPSMMYRTLDGELLDTNLKHYRYISNFIGA